MTDQRKEMEVTNYSADRDAACEKYLKDEWNSMKHSEAESEAYGFKKGHDRAIRESAVVIGLIDALEYYSHNVTFETYEEKSRALDALSVYDEAIREMGEE